MLIWCMSLKGWHIACSKEGLWPRFSQGQDGLFEEVHAGKLSGCDKKSATVDDPPCFFICGLQLPNGQEHLQDWLQMHRTSAL